jgi:hypothetical protein
MTRLAVDWRPLEPPREPVAVLADGLLAHRLAESASRRLADGADLRIAVGGGALLILSEAEVLPWAPGVTYLGRDHGLLLPTTVTPTVPVDLLETAVHQLLLSRQHGPSRHVAVLPGRVITFDVSETPVDSAVLHAHAAEAFA